jgi:hypothetical protein
MSGGKVIGYWGYPHFREDKRFFFGRMRHKGEYTRSQHMWRHIAPLIKAVPLFILWILLGIFVWLPLLPLAFWEFTDIAVWVVGFIRKNDSDGGKFRKRWNENA